MKLRTLVVAIVALAALSAVVALLRRSPTPTAGDPKVNQPLVDRTTIEKSTALRLSEQGKTVVLVRGADGTWVDRSYFDLPADFQKLTRFIDELTTAKLQRLVTSNPERIARLEFKDTKIELLDGADQVLWSVTLGRNAESGGRFVRFGAEAKAYLASLNAWLDPEAKNWADAQLLKVKPEDVAKLELTLPPHAGAPGESIVISRVRKEDPWTADQTPAGQKVKADKVTAVVSALASLRFSDTTEPKDEKVATAKQHERAYKVTTFDGKTYAIVLGQKPEEKKLKPPAAASDGQSALAGLKVTDLTKDEKPAAASAGKETAAGPVKPLAPEFETIPAGPAFASITSSEANAPINTVMQKRAFQVADYAIGALPQTTAELFEPAPAAPVPPATTAAPAAAGPTATPPPAEPAKK